MAWFSLWIPLLLQAVVPAALLAWITRPAADRATVAVPATVTALYVSAIGLAGLWLVLPWWLPLAYAALAAAAAGRAWTRAAPRTGAAGRWRTAVWLVSGIAGAVLAAVLVVALMARRVPDDAVDLAFPLNRGTYLVLNGGSALLVNAHLATLDSERFRAYRGQSHGVDLVRVNRLGVRARGLLPADPREYMVFGDRVGAPCDGVVVAAVDGAPDMSPPQPDRSHMAGNHAMLDCGGVHVLLGHLQRGTVAVSAGQTLRTGDLVGRVGNSGNTGEPHLHVHAQRAGSVAEPMSGDPLPVRFDGRYLVRNARVERRPAAAATHDDGRD